LDIEVSNTDIKADMFIKNISVVKSCVRRDIVNIIVISDIPNTADNGINIVIMFFDWQVRIGGR